MIKSKFQYSWVVVFSFIAVGGMRLARALEPRSMAAAQAGSDQPASVELEQMLFVQAPENGIPKDGIQLIWLPEPLEKLCLGKTASKCATIDYCIRTTNRDDSRCRNLGINLARIPRYPPGTRPARMLSITLFRIRELKGNGYGLLQDFYKSAPQASLQRISLDARVKARIQFIRKADDDDFNLLQILAVPSL
jgi:hypothetical protein